ncbi:MAG: TIGR03013 family XrtA/PEP-CTERM system glycosyltransferase [Nitrospirota bacterium]
MLRIFSRYIPISTLLFWGVEAGLILSVVWAANRWHFSAAGDGVVAIDPAFLNILWVVPLCQLSLYFHDLYVGGQSQSTWNSCLRIFQSIALAALVVLAHCIFFPHQRFGLGMVVALASLPFTLIVLRAGYTKLVTNPAFGQRLLLVGESRLIADLVSALNARPDCGYTIAARLSEIPSSELTGPQSVGQRGHDATLDRVVDRYGITRVVVALGDSRGKLPVNDLLRCRFAGIKIDHGLSFFERLTGKVHVDSLKPSWLIFSEGFNRHRFGALAKRGLDVVGSLVGLAVSAPVMVLVALAIRLDSPGPIFYRQERVGAGGKRFTLVKFRSMRADAESLTGPVWAKRRDDRVTRVGAWLREFRLDELPQLLNVLRGEMSFVGPRPERPMFVEELEAQIPYYGFRHTVKPGLTGWAQVRYRYGGSVGDTVEKLQYDLYYIKNTSFLLDATILFETIKIVLLRRGAR